MEVLCACDESYLPHAAAMLCSLLEHNSVSKIHFFYSSVPEEELAKLESFIATYGSKVLFYEMTSADFEDLPVDKWASAAVYFRLLAPRLLPDNLDKVLYLDTDIIVRGSLTELWNTDLSGHALAAAPHNKDEDHLREALGLPEGTEYFNSGVLLINLRFCRERGVVENAISFVREHPEKIQFWDQDALNATLVNQWVELPKSWNWRDKVRPSTGKPESEPAIVHFVGHDKPWHWSNRHPFRHEYRKYRRKSPWPYKAENRPSFPRQVEHFVRPALSAILPGSLRRWLKFRRLASRRDTL